MGITETRDDQGIAEIVVDVPPVNALTVAGWFELAEKIIAAGKDLATRVVVLRSEGKGFNAGVDIKEMQNTEGFTALIDANRGCFHAFRAVNPSVFCISLMSTPALKPRPSARRITTWVLRSRPASVMASPSSNQPRDGIALTFG